MAKTKTVYVCSNCGADSPKWLGKCPNCGEWNTYVEEIVTKEPAVKRPVPGIMEGNKIRPVLLRDITTEEEARTDYRMIIRTVSSYARRIWNRFLRKRPISSRT